MKADVAAAAGTKIQSTASERSVYRLCISNKMQYSNIKQLCKCVVSQSGKHHNRITCFWRWLQRLQMLIT